jgi:hypothetical protein
MITIQNDEYIPVNQPSPALNFEIQKSSIQRPMTANASYSEEVEPPSVSSYPSVVGRRYVIPSTVLNADVRILISKNRDLLALDFPLYIVTLIRVFWCQMLDQFRQHLVGLDVWSMRNL